MFCCRRRQPSAPSGRCVPCGRYGPCGRCWRQQLHWPRYICPAYAFFDSARRNIRQPCQFQHFLSIPCWQQNRSVAVQSWILLAIDAGALLAKGQDVRVSGEFLQIHILQFVPLCTSAEVVSSLAGLLSMPFKRLTAVLLSAAAPAACLTWLPRSALAPSPARGLRQGDAAIGSGVAAASDSLTLGFLVLATAFVAGCLASIKLPGEFLLPDL